MSTYRIPFRVEFHPDSGTVTPLRMEVDFAEFLPAGRLVDPHTLKAVRELDSGVVREYRLWFSEQLYYGNRGTIALAVDQPELGGTWTLHVAVRTEDGTLAPFPDYIPPVGVGDELLLNSRRWAPIRVSGMHPFPLSVDWDQDGRVDVLSTSHYSNAQGMPWAGVFFFKNIGSNAVPRFAPPLRLYAEGVDEQDRSQPGVPSAFPGRRDFISEYYIRADVFPWFEEGRLDLITVSLQSPYIKVYRNLGKRDTVGLPRLELALKFPNPGAFRGLRVVDWDDDGNPSLVLGATKVDYGVDRGRIVLWRNVSNDPYRPEFHDIPMHLGDYDRELIGGKPWSFDLYDIDGDGELELIVAHTLPPAGPTIKVYKNGGSKDRPRWYDIGNTRWFCHHTSFGFRFVDKPAFHGMLLGSVNAGWGIHYYKRNLTQPDPLAEDAFRDQGPLLGEGVKLSAEGYVSPFVCDPDDDGDMDLVLGDEVGFVTLAEDVGTPRSPRWRVPEPLRVNHKPIRLYREGILHDHDLEMWCGQTKPVWVDWDGDGVPDLLVGNNTNRLFFFKGLGKRDFALPQEIKVEGWPFPFHWRQRPFAIDWDGDGLMDLVAVDQECRVRLFQRAKRGSTQILLPGEPLRYEDGQEIDTNTIPPGIYKNISVMIWVCDWDGDGDWDLLLSSNLQTSFLENVGTNETPLFRRPRPLYTLDGIIEICHHESSAAAVDWDGDGDLDVIIGGESGTLYFFRRDWLEQREHRTEIG